METASFGEKVLRVRGARCRRYMTDGGGHSVPFEMSGDVSESIRIDLVEVHDLHLWGVSSDDVNGSVHLVLAPGLGGSGYPDVATTAQWSRFSISGLFRTASSVWIGCSTYSSSAS